MSTSSVESLPEERTSHAVHSVVTQSDLRGLKEELTVQREEMKRLHGLLGYLQKEMKDAPVRHTEAYTRITHGAKASHEEMERLWEEVAEVRRRKKELLREKEPKQQELMASLLNHFRSTVESRVKDVQRRVGEASG